MATAKWDGKRWRIRITENGRTRSFSTTTPGRKGRAELEERVRKESTITTRAKFGEAWERYIRELGYLTGPEHVRNVESIYRNYLSELTNRYLVEITVYEYQDLIFKARKKNGELLAKKTYNNIKTTLVSFSKFCVRAGLLDKPLSELQVPRDAKKVGKVILQPDQIRRLFNEFNNEWYIDLWRWLLLTGCRPGEAFGLKWKDIHDGVVTISRAYNYQGRMTEGKNENARRTFAINSILAKVLDDQKNRTWRLDSEFVFCNHEGKAARQSDARHSWDRIADELNTLASPYSLRHTFISHMANILPEQVLKSIVGHSTSMDTYGVYKHAVNGEAEQAAEQTGAAFIKLIK